MAVPTCGLDLERRLSAPAAAVRRALADSLREQGFKVTADLVSRIEAKRGSLLGTSLLMKKTLAVIAMAEVTTDATGTSVSIRLADNIPNLGKTWGVNRLYHDTLAEIARHLDAALARLDGSAASAFGEPRFWSRSADLGVIEQGNVVAGKAGEAAVSMTARALEGSSDQVPSAWKGVDAVTFRSSPGVAVMSLADVQALLGIAVMVSWHPGTAETSVVRDAEAFAAGVERRLNVAGGRAVAIDLPEEYAPVLQFLWGQSRIRTALPMRELHVCATCRTEKITNPEYEKLASRNEKLGDIVAGVGATITSGGISPTFVLGQVFKLKRLTPDYVCGRCQGMTAEEYVVTFCPGCAELERGSILGECAKCGFDYATKAPEASPWTEPEVEAAPPAEPVPVVAPSVPVDESAVSPAQPAGRAAWPAATDVPLGEPVVGPHGKICGSCGLGFPSLWRLVVSTSAGFEERFVCGSSAACQAPSHVPAFRV